VPTDILYTNVLCIQRYMRKSSEFQVQFSVLSSKRSGIACELILVEFLEGKFIDVGVQLMHKNNGKQSKFRTTEFFFRESCRLAFTRKCNHLD
jgi:hypothetical protein